MIDSLLRFLDRALQSDVLERLGVAPKGYALVTLHRPSNVDHPDQLRLMAEFLNDLAGRLPLVFPINPRTRQRMADSGISSDHLILTPPLGYLDFLRLMADCRFVLTDSGGIQEETTVLGVPCLTLRENTERPITVEQGTNRLVGPDPEAARAAVDRILSNGFAGGRVPELWDGHASARIIDVVARRLL